MLVSYIYPSSGLRAHRIKVASLGVRVNFKHEENSGAADLNMIEGQLGGT
jgi:hypothetical protein